MNRPLPPQPKNVPVRPLRDPSGKLWGVYHVRTGKLELQDGKKTAAFNLREVEKG